MFVKVLGSAAGGGFPQWNCNCPNCRGVRADRRIYRARTHNSLAVSDDGKAWVLLNATPDIHAQIVSCAELQPGGKVRGTPIFAVLLTDAELDHTIGLLHLRESAEIEVYAASPVLQALEGPFPIRQMLGPYAAFTWSEVKLNESFPLFGGRLIIHPFYLGCKPPRYAAVPDKKEPGALSPWVIGYRIEDQRTGGSVVYAPGVESWTDELDRHSENADCILMDGTFWQSDELNTLGISELKASDMGHLPIAGPGGSLERLANLSAGRKIYVHINNTNPILHEDSSEYRCLRALGIEVGYDGLELEV